MLEATGLVMNISYEFILRYLDRKWQYMSTTVPQLTDKFYVQKLVLANNRQNITMASYAKPFSCHGVIGESLFNACIG